MPTEPSAPDRSRQLLRAPLVPQLLRMAAQVSQAASESTQLAGCTRCMPPQRQGMRFSVRLPVPRDWSALAPAVTVFLAKLSPVREWAWPGLITLPGASASTEPAPAAPRFTPPTAFPPATSRVRSKMGKAWAQVTESTQWEATARTSTAESEESLGVVTATVRSAGVTGSTPLPAFQNIRTFMLAFFWAMSR